MKNNEFGNNIEEGNKNQQTGIPDENKGSQQEKDLDKNKLGTNSSETEEAKIQELDDTYARYRVDDIDISQTSEEDIETKMNRMIEIIRQGGNIEEFIEPKDKLKKMKENTNMLEKQKQEKEQLLKF